MDTSKEYIKICVKTEEIQKLRKKWQWSDFYCETPIEWLNKGKSPSISVALSINNKRYKNETWLPRQDQLQEMVDNKKPDELIVRLINYLQDNQKYYKNEAIKKLYPTNSMERIWLAFVMKEKYNKIWNGKEWIKEIK